jgi:hypothetical protein
MFSSLHSIFELLLASSEKAAQRTGAEPPCGWRSETKRESERFKNDAILNWSLDSVVGW